MTPKTLLRSGFLLVHGAFEVEGAPHPIPPHEHAASVHIFAYVGELG